MTFRGDKEESKLQFINWMLIGSKSKGGGGDSRIQTVGFSVSGVSVTRHQSHLLTQNSEIKK